MAELSELQAWIAEAHDAIEQNDRSDQGYEAVDRAVARVLQATSSPDGRELEEVQDLVEVHAQLTGGCECALCLSV